MRQQYFVRKEQVFSCPEKTLWTFNRNKLKLYSENTSGGRTLVILNYTGFRIENIIYFLLLSTQKNQNP